MPPAEIPPVPEPGPHATLLRMPRFTCEHHARCEAGIVPSEPIGTCGVAQWPDRDQIARELEFGIAYLRILGGPEPAGSSLEVIWRDHDNGQYAEISLVWASGTPVGLSEYLEQCKQALEHLDECVDWSGLREATQLRRPQDPRDSEEKHASRWDRLGCWLFGHRPAADRERGYLDRAHWCPRCLRWLQWRLNHDLAGGSPTYMLVPWEGRERPTSSR